MQCAHYMHTAPEPEPRRRHEENAGGLRRKPADGGVRPVRAAGRRADRGLQVRAQRRDAARVPPGAVRARQGAVPGAGRARVHAQPPVPAVVAVAAAAARRGGRAWRRRRSGRDAEDGRRRAHGHAVRGSGVVGRRGCCASSGGRESQPPAGRGPVRRPSGAQAAVPAVSRARRRGRAPRASAAAVGRRAGPRRRRDERRAAVVTHRLKDGHGDTALQSGPKGSWSFVSKWNTEVQSERWLLSGWIENLLPVLIRFPDKIISDKVLSSLFL